MQNFKSTKYKPEIDFKIRKIIWTSRKLNWSLLFIQKPLIQLEREDVILKYDFILKECYTTLTHPIQGTKILKRENVTVGLLKQILDNPRIHTDDKVTTYYVK